MRTVATESTEPVVLSPSTTVQDASAAMLDSRAEAAIVLDGKKIFGVVTAAGVAQALADGLDLARTPVTVIAGRALLIGGDEPLAEAHLRMRAAQQRFAVVVNDDRRPTGLLADHEAAP